MKRCSNGHYYDPKKNKYCPFCGIDVVLNPQNSLKPNKKKKFLKKNKVNKNLLEQQSMTVMWEDIAQDQRPINNPIHQKPVSAVSNQEKTVLIQSSKQQIDLPLPVGWLVHHQEMSVFDLPIRVGMNFVYQINGRLALRYSKEHDTYLFILIYDPKQNHYYLKTNQSSIRINGDVVESHVVLDGKCEIQSGSFEITFIPLCNEKFQWSNR